MSKKVCFRKEYCPGKIPKRNRRFHCPANTNSKCEIIPKKPKAKYKRVKAFCYKSTVSKGYIAWEKPTQSPAQDKGWLPCTILIEARYLKDKR
jgi:hypothetical protein